MRTYFKGLFTVQNMQFKIKDQKRKKKNLGNTIFKSNSFKLTCM